MSTSGDAIALNANTASIIPQASCSTPINLYPTIVAGSYIFIKMEQFFLRRDQGNLFSD